MPPRPVARLAVRLLLVLLAGLASWSGGGVADAQPLKSVGEERVVGRNRTGEECRLRLLERRAEQGFFERYGLF